MCWYAGLRDLHSFPHDALPISESASSSVATIAPGGCRQPLPTWPPSKVSTRSLPKSSRSEEHTSELQSHVNLVCRLLLEKKNPTFNTSALCIDASHWTGVAFCL